MNLFSTGNFNGKFMRPNSSLPIAGQVASTAFNRCLIEAKIATNNGTLIQGQGVVVTSGQTASVNAGSNLAPNVLTATKSTTSADGIVVESANSVVLQGNDFPQFLDNQVARVALFGSGAEVYLPINSTAITASGLLYWDTANQELNRAAAVPTSNAVAVNGVITSQVVNGIKGKVDTANGNKVTTESCYVVKVKL